MIEEKAGEAEIVIEENNEQVVENETSTVENEKQTVQEQQGEESVEELDKPKVEETNVIEETVSEVTEEEKQPTNGEAPNEEENTSIESTDEEEIVEESTSTEEVVDDGAESEKVAVEEVVDGTTTKPETDSKSKKDKGKYTKPKRMYERDPELERILTVTVKTLKNIPHITSVDCRSKNNRHFTLRVESAKIANLFLHGINKVGIYSDPKVLIKSLEKVLTHWNENLGILPDDCFNVCVMRLELAEQQKQEVSSAALLSNEEIRKRVYLHYSSARYEWRSRAIMEALSIADQYESKTVSAYGLSTRVRKYTEWTPELESMEAYFHIEEDCLADIEISPERMREVGLTMKILDIRNPLIIGHLVKINAMRKRHMAEIAEGIKKGTITINPINTDEVDVQELKNSMLSIG